MLYRSVACAICLAFGVVHTASAQTLKLAEVQWGFDGRVTPNEFNPLCVLLDNQGDEAFEGIVTLKQRRGTGTQVGATFATVAYLPPLQRSWVRFVPYMTGDPDGGDWEIGWRAAEVSERTGRRSTGTERLPKVSLGQAALVLFSDTDSFGSSAKGIKHYDESLFPVAVTATHGLRSAVLDHEPRWLAPQRQAFADWVLLGGQVHLLKSEDGTYPTFTEELSILNGPASPEGRRVGSGAVYTHALQASDLRGKTKFPEAARAREAKFRGDGGPDEEFAETLAEWRSGTATGYYSSIQYGWDAAERAHSSLVKITQPDHNWPLIFLLAFVYILMIFPGCYLLGRKRFHYLITYGAILGAAGLFSVAFLIIGRRGYGERTEINAVAVARQIEGDRWDIMQWSNVFVTTGGQYDLQHKGDGSIYATGQELEKVNGQIALADRKDENVGRQFLVDIPPFSNRPYVHRQTAKIEGLEGKLESFAATDRVKEVEISVGPKLQSILSDSISVKLQDSDYMYNQSATLARLPILRLAYRNELYSLKYNSGKLTLAAGLGKIHSAVNISSLQNAGSAFGYLTDDEKPSPESRYARMFDAMVSHRFGIFKDVDFANTRLRSDVVRLLIYMPMPEEMSVVGDSFPNQRGYVLFSQDLLVDEPNDR